MVKSLLDKQRIGKVWWVMGQMQVNGFSIDRYLDWYERVVLKGMVAGHETV